MKSYTLLSTSLFLVATAACASDDTPALDATFADASDALLLRAQTAGVASDGVIAAFSTSGYAGVDSPAGCPRVITDGDTTTVTGGCTTEGGATISGRAILTNVPSFDEEAPSEGPSTFEFEGFRTSDIFAFDGTVTFADDTVVIDLIATIDGIEATSSLRLTSAGKGNVTADDGSWIEVTGLGAAAVSGVWGFGDPPTGTMTLDGADRITFDFDAATSECIPYSIDGTPAGSVCLE